MSAESKNYLQFHEPEDYLLQTGNDFRSTGQLSAVDFYMILIWKANRAKNYHKKRLKEAAEGSFDKAVSRIAGELYREPEPKKKLEILMSAPWAFYLPTATAILTILYPDEFTVYDILVCGQLRVRYRRDRPFSNALWSDYQDFKARVIQETPADLSLRQRDRYLIGRANRQSALKEYDVLPEKFISRA